jgi:hypothetical protein
MDDEEIKMLEVFSIFQNQIKKYADIKIKYGEIIWMNTNLKTTGVRQGVFKPGERTFKFKIETISKNLIEKFNGKINHRIFIEYPYDDELYVNWEDAQNNKEAKTNQSSGFFKIQYRTKIKPIVSAIKILKPIWKFIIAIVVTGIGGLFAYILIELYKKLLPPL